MEAKTIWYRQSGPESDVAVSTRIRLARNLRTFPFPIRMTLPQRREMNEQVRAAAALAKGLNLRYVDMDEISDVEAEAMVERHIVSPEFAGMVGGRNSRNGRALLLSEDESISVMLGEEDHIRIQAMGSGLRATEAYPLCDRLDDLFCEGLPIAFNERLGFLTECLTNLGTGLRASAMLHLPALTASGKIQASAAIVSKLGMTVRGIYGEGSQPKGNLYQLSNQITLGISEEAAIQNLSAVAMQLIRMERTARNELSQSAALEDKVWRAYGILQNARLLPVDEFMELISYLRWGSAMGLLPGVSVDKVDSLMVDAQPAMLISAFGSEENESPEDVDRLRADYVRNQLSTIRNV